MTQCFSPVNYSRPVPRYTSYPPATQFKDLALQDRLLALREMDSAAPVSIYLHLPFCASLCYYCGCFTSVTQRPERIEQYLSALENEIRMVFALLPAGITVNHIHFGGGSPTMLSPPQFISLARTLKQHITLTPDAEIAIEADPRQLTEEKIKSYAQSGVTRISFGVQDFHQETLASVNRRQEVTLTRNAVDWCRQHGIEQINFDLMYGLPHQTVDTIRETVAIATLMNPSRFAFFGYAHVPWMKKHMNAMDYESIPDTAARYDLFKAGSEALEAAGYLPVGIDHYVRPDDGMYCQFTQRTLQRNFQGYTTDTSNALLGFGASAISTLPFGYVQNRADIASYEAAIAARTFPPSRGWQWQADDRIRGEIINTLMCYFEVNLARFSAAPEREFADAYERLRPLMEEGAIRWENHRLRILIEPQLMARLVASAFDRYTPWLGTQDNTPQRHAQAI